MIHKAMSSAQDWTSSIHCSQFLVQHSTSGSPAIFLFIHNAFEKRSMHLLVLSIALSLPIGWIGQLAWCYLSVFTAMHMPTAWCVLQLSYRISYIIHYINYACSHQIKFQLYTFTSYFLLLGINKTMYTVLPRSTWHERHLFHLLDYMSAIKSCILW